MEKLPGDYIAGFVDGEGCFYITFRRDVRHERKNKPVYFYWRIGFAIVLRKDDKEILEGIQQTLSCGRISFARRGLARYEVNNIDDLSNKIATFFEQHPLHAKKKFDFALWKEALEIIKRNQQKTTARGLKQVGFSKILWQKEDLQRLKEISEAMKTYKSNKKEWKWL